MMSDKPFSERMGFTQPKPVQINDLDDDARTALYNAYLRLLSGIPSEHRNDYQGAIATRFLKMSLTDAFFTSRIGMTQASGKLVASIDAIFFRNPWYESFNLIEFICPVWVGCFDLKEHQKRDFRSAFAVNINHALKQENVGFRFLEGKFVPIQSQEEEETIDRAMKAPYAGARKQIRRAVSLFSARPNPDYANSIKDSIGAVESICEEISGEKGFSAAVNNLGISMHPAFQRAAKQLYGFTSDDAGIRHAATGEPPLQVNQATARYMLIVCSAMVNFITDQKSDAE